MDDGRRRTHLASSSPRQPGSRRGANGTAEFSFVQISDSHIGFNKAANQDVTGTLKLAIDKINALPGEPDLLLHTGDITHSSKPAEFDTAQQIVKGAKARRDLLRPRRARHRLRRRRALSRTLRQRNDRAPAGTASPTRASTSSASTTRCRSTSWASSAPISSPGSRTIWPRSRHRRPSSSSPTFRYGWSIPTGAGARRTAPRRCPT